MAEPGNPLANFCTRLPGDVYKKFIAAKLITAKYQKKYLMSINRRRVHELKEY